MSTIFSMATKYKIQILIIAYYEDSNDKINFYSNYLYIK